MPQDVAYDANASQELVRAVRSIPAYVENCAIFLVLAPPCKHFDRVGEPLAFSSWLHRGWCRMEVLSTVLAQRLGFTIVVESPTRMKVLTLDTLISSGVLEVGNGAYTCCTRRHIFFDQLMACDKARVAEVTLQLLATLTLNVVQVSSWRPVKPPHGTLICSKPPPTC